MTTTINPTTINPANLAHAPAIRPMTWFGVSVTAAAGMASLGAGAIHAVAAGSHAEHPQARNVFIATAVVQLLWGYMMQRRSSRLLAVAGLAANLGLVAGWLLAKTKGIGFIDGLESVEKVQFADGLSAVLATIAVAGAFIAVLAPTVSSRRRSVTSVVVAGIVGLTFPGMADAAGHHHAGGHDHHTVDAGHDESSHVHSDGESSASTHSHPSGGVIPPFDPTRPIDLSGVDGVTEAQQAEAENLVAITLLRLPRFADPATAEALGWKSIHDGATGFEHYVNWSLIEDHDYFNPDQPESLVYRVDPATQQKTLVAAMYMVSDSTKLNEVPPIGGKLIQWHIHDNLCFNTGDWPMVQSVAAADGTCPTGLVKHLAPMIHVWITANPCGPFAALDGIAGGQVAEGERPSCNHTHGN
jgi:hypothetical protein